MPAKKPFAWSFSALDSFETCPKRYWHLNVARDIKEEENEAMRFGSYAHKAFEHRLKEGTPLPIDLKHHEKLLARLAGARGTHYTEQRLALNRDFEPTGWWDSDVWVRAITDYTIVDGDKGATFDWKFGRQKDGFDQINLVSVILFSYFEELQIISGAYYWAKDKQVRRDEVTRLAIPEVWNSLLPRVEVMEDAYRNTDYPAKPSGLCKRHCPVRPASQWRPAPGARAGCPSRCRSP